MNKKLLSYGGLLVFLFIFVVSMTGCDSAMNNTVQDVQETARVEATSSSGVSLMSNSEDNFHEVTLFAGQDIDVGNVTVNNDDEKIYVKYETKDGWKMTETHLHIALAGEDEDLEYFGPVNNSGNPQVGLFDEQTEHDPAVDEYMYEIDLNDWDVDDELIIAAHAVVERVTINTGTINPELSWERSSEENVAHFPGRGAGWSKDQGFAIDLDPNELVWDGGTDFQNDARAGSNPAISYATYKYAYGDGGDHSGEADLRRFQAEFNIPEGYEITGGRLDSVNEGYSDIIVPINDNIYIFINENLLFWGGTIINLEGDKDFLGLAGVEAVRGGEEGAREPSETDGWYIPGQIPDIDKADFVDGNINVLDVFAEEFSLWGAMHELGLTLNYEEKIIETETAWADGKRFVERGNWATYFKYTVKEFDPGVVIYGITGANGNGELFEIKINGTDITETSLIETNVSGDQYSGNGLAFDEDNNRLYFAAGSGSSGWKLYFYDFNGNIHEAASGLPGPVYGATFGDGQYWYILNGTDNMHVVKFDGNGENGAVSDSDTAFAGGKDFTFGDIALDYNGLVIYGSTSRAGADEEFFEYDLNEGIGSRYEEISNQFGIGFQLAFGENGILYGTGNKELYTINLGGGSAGLINVTDNAYNDLANGPTN